MVTIDPTVASFLLVALLAILHFATRRKRPRLKMVLDAIQAQELIRPADPGPGWPELPGHIRVANSRVSILYWRTEREGHVAETIDVALLGGKGYFIITFGDERVLTWTEGGRATVQGPELDTSANILAYQILKATREAVERTRGLRR